MPKNFSIISYLTGEDFKRVREIQKAISVVTGSQKCLVDWLPHITVGDGVTLDDAELLDFEEEMSALCSGHHTVRAKMKGFGGIDNWKGAVEGKITPFVLWLEVELSDDLVTLHSDIQTRLTSQYPTWLPRTVTYTPHITIGFADLDKDGYAKGLEYLSKQSFEHDFVINHVALVECFGEGNMESVEHKKFYLGE